MYKMIIFMYRIMFKLFAAIARLFSEFSVVEHAILTTEPYESNSKQYEKIINFAKKSICDYACVDGCVHDHNLPVYYNEDLCEIVTNYSVTRENWNKELAMERFGDWLITRELTKMNILEHKMYNLTEARDGSYMVKLYEPNNEEIENAYDFMLKQVVTNDTVYDFAVKAVCDNKCILDSKVDYGRRTVLEYWYDECVLVTNEAALSVLYDKNRCKIIKYFENNDQEEDDKTLIVTLTSGVICCVVVIIVTTIICIKLRKRKNVSESQ